MAQYTVNWEGPVSSAASTISATYCVCPTSGGFVVATSANRTTYGRPSGIAVTAGTTSIPIQIIEAGPLTATQTGLGTGTAAPLRVSSTGLLERVATPSASDDVVGYCFTDGSAHVMFGVLTHRVYVDSGGGGGGGSPGGSNTQIQYNNSSSFGGIAGLTYDGSNVTATSLIAHALTNSIDATQIHLQVRNTSGGTLAAGTPVYATGYNTGQACIEVATADADDAAKMPVIGLIEDSLANNTNGTAVVAGRLASASTFDTSSFSVGAMLYVSTAGALTATKPTTAAAQVQAIAIVLRSHATLGEVVVLRGPPADFPNRLTDDRLRIVDDGDTSKVAALQCSGITTATTRTFTFPDADMTFAGLDTTQTLTNKTIAGASNTLSVRIANDVTGLGTGVATFLATPSGANLASALTTALPDSKGGTGLTALGTGVATFLGTPSGANLASALTTALPDSKGGTGLTALGANVATMLGTFSSANIRTACTDETGSGGSLVFATSPTLTTPVINGQTQGAAVAMGALAIDWSLGTVFTKTLSAGSNTITFSNQTSGMVITVRLTSNGGGSTVTWPTVKWAGGAAPTQTSTGIDVYTFVHDGTSVYGSVVQAMA